MDIRSLKTRTEDWADDLPEALSEELELAIQEADSGKDGGVSHSEMIRKYKKKHSCLNQ